MLAAGEKMLSAVGYSLIGLALALAMAYLLHREARIARTFYDFTLY
ncbi:MAG: hypothetical protein QXM16_05855 [Nitrososphaerota archaeon]